MTGKAAMVRFALVLAIGATLVGCAVLRIDVDVYKGPLANHEDVQMEQFAAMAIGAKPLMIALRARGLGSTWTTLHLVHEREAARLLGIPDDVTQTVLLPVGYVRDAVLRPAARRPAHEVTYWNEWGRLR